MRKLMLAGLLIMTAGCASRKDLEKAQSEATSLAAEKDSLLSEVLATSKLVSDVNSELAKAKGLGVSPTTTSEGTTASSAAEDRQILLGKIREAVARLNESEAQLERTKARIGSLERKDARLLKQIDDFQKQIAELRTNIEAQQATIEEQKTTIVAQKVQIDQLGAQVETVTVKNRQLADSVTLVSNEANKVFLAIGTKDSLKSKGVIVQEGKKFLVFGGKQTVPARELNPAAFQVLDARTDRSITLPEGKKYKIVSRQDAKLLQPGPDDKGKLVGTQTITNPEEFWGASKYLIIVEDSSCIVNGTAQARIWACAVFFFGVIAAAPARAQAPAVEQQVAGALLAAPDSLRAGATVLGYRGSEVVEIRKGTNELICLADDPATERFQVACYQKALEPFMARGRELHQLKLSHTAVDSARLADIKAGRWKMPETPTALYNLVAAKDSLDAATGLPRGNGTRWYVVYIPYATEASSGFTTSADGSGRPWLMNPGEPWAHLMVTPR